MPSMAVVTPAAEAEDTQAVAAGSTGVADPSGDITVAGWGVATTAVDTPVDFTPAQDPAPTPDAGRWAACTGLPPVTGGHRRVALGRGKVTALGTPLPAGISLVREIAGGWAARRVEPHPGTPAKPRWQERTRPRARVSPMAIGTPLAPALVRRVQAPFRTYI